MLSSPFEAVHQQLGARFSNYDGWSLPADFGNTDAEIAALNGHCAVVDLCSFGRIQVKGPGVKDVLNTLFTEKSGPITTDSWVWAKTKTPDKQDIVCRIACTNGDFFLLTQPTMTEAILSAIESSSNGIVITSDVTTQTAMLGLYGPKAYTSLRGVLPFDIDYLEIGDVEKMSFMMLSFTLLRGSWLGGDGVELICPAAAGPLAAGAVAKYRHKHNITPAGMDCLQTAMAETNSPF